MTSSRPGRPKRRAFTAAYKARILAEYDALPDGSPQRGELMRRERICGDVLHTSLAGVSVQIVGVPKRWGIMFPGSGLLVLRSL